MIHTGRRSVASPRQARRKRSFTRGRIAEALWSTLGPMLRLVAYAPDGVRRFPIHRSELIIGSWPECDICLQHTGVAQRHARLLYDGKVLRIEDLGTRKGLSVSGRKVREATLEVLDEIRLGNVTLLVEDILPAPEKAQAPPQEEPANGTPRITSLRMIEHLNRISEWVLADTESRTTSESLVRDVLADFGGGALFLLTGMEEPGLKLVVTTDPVWLASGEGLLEQLLRHRETTGDGDRGGSFHGELGDAPAWIFHQSFAALDRHYTLLTALPRFDPGSWSPAASLSSLGHLLVLGLVHHVGSYEPILPGRPGQQDLTLDPNLVVGESQAMKQVIDQLRAAVDPPVHVRLVVGSRMPLDAVAARDLFRVALAYRLSQFPIQVPPLRARREDLPLLIQSYINRFCHETGKRVQGITVKAMSALLSYDYPGNLAELENTARQLVYMAPAGRPVDINLLPERVRDGNLTS